MIKDFKKAPKSVKFWNLLVLTILVTTGVFSIELLAIELIFGSIFTIGLVAEDEVDNNFWIILMPITWVLGIVGGIIILSAFLYKNIVEKFNNWIDR